MLQNHPYGTNAHATASVARSGLAKGGAPGTACSWTLDANRLEQHDKASAVWLTQFDVICALNGTKIRYTGARED
jgi:hypothetical protein